MAVVAGQISDAERIAALRTRCMERKNRPPAYDGSIVDARSLRASESVGSWQVRCGLRTRDRLAAFPLAVDDLELLMGRPAPASGPVDAAERSSADAYLATYKVPGGQAGHCELYLGNLFAVGIDGVRRRLAKLQQQSSGEKAETYQSFLYALDGFSAFIDQAAAVARASQAQAPPWRRAELRETADSCARIAHGPPATFRDAIQLVWLADVAVAIGDHAGLVVPGHLDRTLRPFYERDVAAGRITRQEALRLIECLYVLINEYIPDGLAMSVMVGGRDPQGSDVTNDLSYLCLEAIRRTALIYPTVGVCWHKGTPPELTRLAVDLMAHGYKTPAFFGDATIQRGLGALGCPPEDRCNYINSTCVEITPVGASNVWVASPYFNTCGYLLEEIAAQAEAAPPAASFSQFVEAYHRRLARHIALAVEVENQNRRDRRQFGGKPLQSVLVRDCIERGCDIDNGGARYNWVECSFVGLANLADSFYVIDREVFDHRTLTFRQLKALLDANFAGHEDVRQRFLNAYPKYGHECPAVDGLIRETVDFLVAECARHKMLPDSSPFVPGCFTWVMHESLGRATGATPDGRRAGFPFADGGGPAQGREVKGPTAAILSTTSWDHSPMIGGLACNMKFNTSLFDSPGSADALRGLIETYLARGGFEIQINVVNTETLRKARAHPEAYRDLIVRIGGYCDYFTRLTPEMQDELILRTEFSNL